MKKIIIAIKAICLLSFLILIGIGISLFASWMTLSEYEFSLWFEEKHHLIARFMGLTPLAVYGFVVFVNLRPSEVKEY